MTTTRKFTSTEADAFALARLRLLANAPYYAAAAFGVAPVACEGLGTWAVDKHWRMYVDPTCLPDGEAGWDAGKCGEVFEHELNHLLRAHASRMDAHAGSAVDPQRSNIACDAEINDDLPRDGFIASIGILPSKLGLPDSQTAEWYYDNLPEQDGNNGNDGGEGEGDGQGNGQSKPTAGSGKCGSGAGGNPIEGELSEKDNTAPAVGDVRAELTRKATAQAVSDHIARNGRGSVPGGLAEWAQITLAPPTVPWQRVLAAEVRRGIRIAKGFTDYTNGRISRRSRIMPGVIVPASISPKPRIAAVVDTSGSMSMEMIEEALVEVHGIANAAGCGPDDLFLVQVDAAVSSIIPFTKRSSVEISGRGGTDMRVGIEAGINNGANVVVVLTDGYTPWPDNRPKRASIVAGIIGDNSGHAEETARTEMPWARVVKVGK